MCVCVCLNCECDLRSMFVKGLFNVCVSNKTLQSLLIIFLIKGCMRVCVRVCVCAFVWSSRMILESGSYTQVQ